MHATEMKAVAQVVLLLTFVQLCYLSLSHAFIPKATRAPTPHVTMSMSGDGTSSAPLFRVRTVTIFVNLTPSMFSSNSSEELTQLVTKSCQILKKVQKGARNEV